MTPAKQKKPDISLILREFIYLDRPKLEDFLSGIEDGIVRQYKEEKREQGARWNGGVKPHGVGIERAGGVSELSSEFIKEATDASLFQRLYSLDKETSFITHISKFDEKQWEELKEGQVVEVESEIDLSALEKIFDTAADILELMEVFQPGSLSDEKSKQFIAYLQLQKRSNTTGVRIEPVKSPAPKYQFVASLQNDNLRASKSELSGTYKVFGRIKRKLKRNEKFDLFKLLPGEMSLGSKELGEMLKGFKDMPPMLGKPPTVKDIKVGYPAMVLTPVAIYR